MIGGKGPMAIVAFRFDETPPTLDELERELRAMLGERLHGCIDSIEVGSDSAARSERVAWVTSQDFVALTYARRVCSDLGGVRVDPSTGEERGLALPEWARIPWPEHSWSARLRIRFGRVGL